MKKVTVLWAAGIGLMTLVLAASNLRASLDDQVNAAVNKVADLLQKGDAAGAKTAAKAIADKADTEDIMGAFKLRNKKGIGLGAKPAAITPDGIELKINDIARDGIKPEALKAEGEALARAGYVIDAVAAIVAAKAPAKDIGKQKRSDWLEWSANLAKASEAFTAAAKGSSANELKKAAASIKQNCDSCHAVFK